MALLKRRYLFEADDDENTEGSSSDGGEDTSGNDDTSTDDTSSEDDSNDDTGDEDTGDDTSEDDDTSDDDFSIDSDPEEGDEGFDDEDGDDDMSSDDSSDEDTSTDSEEKELDRELFDSLSDAEKKAKIDTLKKLFIEMYSNCDMLVDRFNRLSSDDKYQDYDEVIKRVLKILYDMKEYVSFYIINKFDGASYIENDVTFNRYLSILNGIRVVAKDLEQIHNDDIKEKQGQ